MTAESISPDATFDYNIPNRYIDCTHLRIHILDVPIRANLNTKQIGLKIMEIYGETLNTSVTQSGFFFLK